MKRHYYISDDLKDLESVEVELENSGVDTEQIHVLSEDDAYLETHHLHAVDSISKKDVIRSGIFGLIIGIVGAVIIFSISYQTGISEEYTWAPALFLSIAFLGFCTWEGGLWGIQKPNRELARFQDAIKSGSHVFFVDIKDDQESIVNRVIQTHPNLKLAGSGNGSPGWVVGTQRRFNKFMTWAP
ncbi:NAD/FAD-utilizing enzyme [Agarilytica rhodophyticola]|uniref:NAD/FAD-utilizing enzyme n=1 Tax=Agarilytica rhodophyticola TaxID=1737490 RepID=UPI000B3439D8|nr:NAD/FAD-utilizing enzyme [Agarilytica rhodophyticola]